MAEVKEPVGTIDPANQDLYDDNDDVVLVDNGDDELLVVRLEAGDGGD